MPILLGSIAVNYILGRKLQSQEIKGVQASLWLSLGVCINLGLLFYFKYAFFLQEFFRSTYSISFGFQKLVLPLAISFFTFQQIGYLVDIYREPKELRYTFVDYALFISFFPQLIAGPIVQHKETVPQFSKSSNLSIQFPNISQGLFLFTLGLSKKVLIADSLAPWVKQGFDQAEHLSTAAAWITSLSYTFQLYFDFSGYTDMALGLALLFNIRLPENFNSPYKALDIQSFWRRWHITLSQFLRVYLYIPLGGNRKGEIRTYVNVYITFLLGGIWHGAGWTFIIWGTLHGIATIIHRIWKKHSPWSLPPYFAWFLTFQFINLTWVFFRARTLDDAFKVLRGMCGLTWQTNRGPVFHGASEELTAFTKVMNLLEQIIHSVGIRQISIYEVTLFVLLCIVVLTKNSNQHVKELRKTLFTMMWTTLLLSLSVLHLMNFSTFLYFQF